MWSRPRVSLSKITDPRERADVEHLNEKLATLPLFGVTMAVRREAVQAWIYEKKTTDSTYLCFLATGEAEKVPVEEIQQRIQEATTIQLQQGAVHPFFPELMPSLIEFMSKYPREHPVGPPYTHWRQLFHLNSREAWLTIRCRECQRQRRVALQFMAMVRLRQHEELWRRCSMMVGVDCEQEETTRIHALDMKQLFDAVQDQRFQSPVRRPDEPQGPEVMPDLEDIVSEFDGTTRGMEVMQHSSALIEIWKSLGKNLKQPTYSGQGNANQLMAWQEDVEMLLQVYSVTGEAQVIAAAKFLQGEAEE